MANEMSSSSYYSSSASLYEPEYQHDYQPHGYQPHEYQPHEY